MAKHNHKFIYIGGGTDLENNKSDMSHKCKCGEKIRVYMSPEVYFTRKFPKVIELK